MFYLDPMSTNHATEDGDPSIDVDRRELKLAKLSLF
jgi:hypothetical protein